MPEFESLLRTDILSDELTEEQQTINVIVETQFNNIIRPSGFTNRLTTDALSKNIVEAMELFGQAIADYDERANKNADARVLYTYNKPDKLAQLEAVSVHLIDRQPGCVSRTSLKERGQSGKTRNIAPLLRELKEDLDNPGYKRAVLGYWFDNTVRFTCWARTNKAALARMMWVEEVMEQYKWFFTLSGVNKVLYDGRGDDETLEIEGNKIYGVSIDYFVRSEKLRAVSQKKLELIYVKLAREAT